MENMYPYIEAIKVYAAYAALLYLWPSVVFQTYLRGKGWTFRFLFCNTVQMVLLNSVVLGLGLLHILNIWIVRALFWGTLALSLGMLARQHSHTGHQLAQNLITGGYGWRMLLLRMWERFLNSWKRRWAHDRSRLVEYLLLIVILLFGTAYFSTGAFQTLSYGCNDQFTHHQWILGLQRGEIFLDGIYPEAMHCFIYGMHGLFGVSIYNCILFLAGIQSSVFLVAAYCLLKEVFRFRYMPLFVLTAWLTFRGAGDMALESIARMSWTIPEEFGLGLVLICPLALLRYLRKNSGAEDWYQDENLLILAMGIGAATAVHFYVLILAFISCLAVILTHFRKNWSVKRLWLLCFAVFSGVEVGAIPMLAAFAMGKNPEASLRWGLDVFLRSFRTTAPPEAEGFPLTELLKGIFENGYVRLFGSKGGLLIALISILIAVSVCDRALLSRHRQKGKRETVRPATISGGYLFLALLAVTFVIMFAAPFVGLPEFVAFDRIVGVTQLLVYSMLGAVLDTPLYWLSRRADWGMSRRWAALACAAIYCCAYLSDFHTYSYWWLRRYDSPFIVTEQIMTTYPQYSYTVISMQDELYQVTGQGRYEELFTFVHRIEDKEYFLPTEYVFLYIEKRPFNAGAPYYLSGPSWLAKEHEQAAGNFDRQINRTDISQESVEKMVAYFPSLISNYLSLETRTVLNAKAYMWYQEFSKVHSIETGIYYEDDDFICYVIHQNPGALLNLAKIK